MKKTILTLAAVLAFSGAAFAGTTQSSKQAPATACVETKAGVKLDCGATGSVEKIRPADVGSTDAKSHKIGIDINPWIMPTTF